MGQTVVLGDAIDEVHDETFDASKDVERWGGR
jgi:hypothetical protein